MKCARCEGEMVQGASPFRIDRKEIHIKFDRVPAWVCTKCGGALFEETEVNAIRELVEAVDGQADKLALDSPR